MSSSDLNTGFTDLEDFVEPEVNEGAKELNQRSMTEAIFRCDPESFKGKFLTNVLRSFVIAGAAILLVLMLVPFGFSGIGLSTVLALSGYVYFSYRNLIPIPKRNLLSVLAPAVVLGVIFLIFHIFDLYPSGSEINFFAFTNLPAIIFTNMLFISVGYGEMSDTQPILLYLIAAIVPSLLMYAGLRIRMRQERRAMAEIGYDEV